MAKSLTTDCTVVYVETDCVIEHEGRKFESGGAVVTDSSAIVYTKSGGILTDWHGNRLGTFRVTSSWRTPRSWVSSHSYAVEARLDAFPGVRFIGRTQSTDGMICRLRKAARQVAR